jgi:curved DNA-binding protein CbpA
MDGEQSLYSRLEVSETATHREIQQAYRRLAKKYHSDTASPGKADDLHVIKLTEAYETLANPEKRQEYDEEVRIKREGRDRVAADAPFMGGSASAEVGPLDHYADEPLLPALGDLLWRVIRAGFRQLPTVFRSAPRVVVVGGLLIVAVIAGSWALRSYSEFSDEAHFKSTLAASLTGACDGRSGIGGRLPEGSSAGLDCDVRGVSVSYFDTEGDYADRYFARHLRHARRHAKLRKGQPGSCARPGHVVAYRYRSSFGVSGRVFCWIDPQGRVRFEWVEQDIYVQAVSSWRFGRVYRWWRKQAGPYAGPVNARVVEKAR